MRNCGEANARGLAWRQTGSVDHVLEPPASKGLAHRLIRLIWAPEKALLVSLDFLDKHSIDAGHVSRPLSYREMHRALCVLAKQDWVPSTVLRWAWKLPDCRSAEKVMKWMEGVGVAHTQYRETGEGVRMLGLRLHDLVHDFAQNEAKRHGQEVQWFAGLLNEYRNRYQSASNGEMLRPVHLNSVEDGGYMFRNVCRLLRGAGQFRELGRLLHSSMWVGMVFERKAILQFEQDVQMYIEAVPAPGGRRSADVDALRNGDFNESLKKVCKVARLCLSDCLVNREEIWFQLYARIAATASRSTWMEEMLAEIEQNAPRPWLRVAGSCLKGADDSMVGTFRWGRDVFCVELMSIGRCTEGSRDACVGRHLSNGETKIVKLAADSSLGTASKARQRTEGSGGVGLGGSRRTVRSTGKRWIDKIKAMRRLGRIRPEVSDVPSAVSQRAPEDEQDSCSPGIRIMPSDDEDTVICGAIARNGLHVVTGWKSGALVLSDSRTGKKVWEEFDAHQGIVWGVAVSGDGRRIVSGSRDRTVAVWDLSSGQKIGSPFIGHVGIVRSVALSEDGTRVVSSSDDKTIRVWNVSSGRQVIQLSSQNCGLTRSVALSTDGTRAVSGSDDETVRLWDVLSGKQIGEPFTGHTDWVRSVAISDDGTLLASGSDDETVRVWDVANGKQVGEAFTGHMDWVMSVSFSRDGRQVVSGSDDKTVRVWEVTSGGQIGDSFPRHTDWVRSVVVSRDGTRVVSGSYDKTVRMWDVSSGRQVGEPFTGHTDRVICVAMSGGGTCIVSGSEDKTVRVWDVSSGQSAGEPLTGHTDWVKSIAITWEGTRVASGSDDRTVRVWDVSRGLQVGEAFTGHEGTVTSVCFCKDETRVVSGSGDMTVRVWEVASGRQIGEPLAGHVGWVRSVATNEDGTRVVSGSDDLTVRVWDVISSSCVSVVEDAHWQGRWDALCLEYVEGDVLCSQQAPQEKMSVTVEESSVLLYRGSLRTVLGTFEEIIEWNVCVRRGVVAVGLRNGAVYIAKVVE